MKDEVYTALPLLVPGNVVGQSLFVSGSLHKDASNVSWR